jgi:hypothetical protein
MTNPVANANDEANGMLWKSQESWQREGMEAKNTKQIGWDYVSS